MHLYLEDRGLDLSVVHDVSQHSGAQIADTDVADESLFDESLHCSPCLLIGHVILLHAWLVAVVVPLGRVSLLEGYELECDWEVNQVQIQVLNAEVR